MVDVYKRQVYCNGRYNWKTAKAREVTHYKWPTQYEHIDSTKFSSPTKFFAQQWKIRSKLLIRVKKIVNYRFSSEKIKVFLIDNFVYILKKTKSQYFSYIH